MINTKPRLSRHRLSVAAMLTASMVVVVMLLLEAFWGDAVQGWQYRTLAGREGRILALAVAVIIGCLLILFFLKGRAMAIRLALLGGTGTLGFVFDPRIFEFGIPQGMWIPFILALALTSLRWSLLVLAATIAVVLAAYPEAYRTGVTIGTSVIVAGLLVIDRIVKHNLVQELLEANRDLTRSQTSLHESEQRYRLLAEQSPLPIIIFAPSGRVVRVNRAWEKLWGFRFADTADYNVFTDPQLVANGTAPLLRRVLAGEDVELPTMEYDWPEGSSAPRKKSLWIRVVAFAVRAADGTPLELVVLQEDVSEQIRAEEQIRHLAYFDPLTQLANRRLLMDRLDQSMLASQRSRHFGALLILDLDNFKALNDTQGHDVGDQLLVEVARRIGAAVREGDTVARLGGDEYVVTLEELSRHEEEAAAQAERVAEKIHGAINQPYLLKGDTVEYHCSTSIGVVLYLGREIPADALLKQADIALYQAKGAGRNAIRFYNPEMQAAIDARMALELALRTALERDEFRLHYQPQVDASGRVIGAEALLRWQSPSLGTVPPARFIPLAEESWLILPLGQWVIDAACRQLGLWATAPETAELQLAVNVSARQFQHADFVPQVKAALVRHGVAPGRLKLELTESVVLSEIDLVVAKMQELDALGVSFSLDDFGTGYSSLSYLKRLPLDQLKIDQSFVRDIGSDPNDAAIIRAILALGESLGIEAIAEGVETRQQFDFLLANGCRAFQGYLFGRPVPIGEFSLEQVATVTTTP